MKKGGRIVSFLSGVLCTLFVVALIDPAVAAMVGKTIQVYTGIKVYVDDKLVEPKDAAGNPVEIFVYNGTTYLPIRAIGNALGLPVQYESSTQSAYVGKHASDTPSAWLADMDYFSGSYAMTTKTTDKDNTGATHAHCIGYGFDRTYLINGQYSAISGVLYQTYDKRSKTADNDACFEIYGDGKLLYSYSFEKTTNFKPVDFNVDLTGVLELRVKFTDTYLYGSMFALGDVGLWS